MPYNKAITEPEIESKFPYSPSCFFYCNLIHIAAPQILSFEGHAEFQGLNSWNVSLQITFSDRQQGFRSYYFFGGEEAVSREMKKSGSVEENAEVLTKVIS